MNLTDQRIRVTDDLTWWHDMPRLLLASVDLE